MPGLFDYIPAYVLSIAQVCLSLGSVIVCMIITLSIGTDVGGIAPPYISDTGREGVAHVIFATGNTISAVVLLIVWYAYYNVFMDLKREYNIESVHFRNCTVAAAALAVVCAVSLTTFTIVSTPISGSIHLYGAILFFIAAIAQTSIVTALTSWLKANATDDDDLKHWKDTYAFRCVVMAFVAISFVIYIPVGLSVLCEWQETSPGVYDYTNCKGAHTMRSTTQHLCVLGLEIYFLTYAYDLYYFHKRTFVRLQASRSADSEKAGKAKPRSSSSSSSSSSSPTTSDADTSGGSSA